MEQAYPLNRCTQWLAFQPRCSHRPAQDCRPRVPHWRGVRSRLALRRHSARLRRQRQPRVNLGRSLSFSTQVPEDKSQRRRQGSILVPLAAQPPRHRWWFPRSPHPLLEHHHWRSRQLHRHRQPSHEPAVEHKLQGDCEHVWLPGQQHFHLVVSFTRQERRDPSPREQSPTFMPEPGWPDPCYRGGG